MEQNEGGHWDKITEDCDWKVVDICPICFKVIKTGVESKSDQVAQAIND